MESGFIRLELRCSGQELRFICRCFYRGYVGIGRWKFLYDGLVAAALMLIHSPAVPGLSADESWKDENPVLWNESFAVVELGL